MVRCRYPVLAGVSFLIAGCQVVPQTADQRSAVPPTVLRCAPTDVFVSGRMGYDVFRIPALVTVRESSSDRPVLVAFAEGRRDGAADHGDIDVVQRVSRDGGCTWSALTRVADAGSDTLGNPAPVVDASGTRMVLLTTRNGGRTTERAIMTGAAASRDGRRVYVQSSTDAGLSWSPPHEITDAVKRQDWRWYATGPGHGITLTHGAHAGRIVVAANHSVAPGPGSSDTGVEPHHYAGHSLISDDGGATWRVGYVDPAGGELHHVNETAVAELPDGQVYFNARNQHGSAPGSRVHAWSRDGGVTLESPFEAVADITAPTVQGSLLHVGDSAAGGSLFMAAPSDPEDRARMTVRTSGDGGATWSDGLVVSPSKAAYSDMARVDADHVGLLYETGRTSAYDAIRFTPIALADLTN
ncbi:exo-alpha-sialidase [Streptomyces finlayi]|uniref:exo-alpha-sialidase n=1 Tax=Streptomyces finlayi TaxID=67296 RepID=A0A7G7BQC4_9ACTN|nr:exo-alpha-sialidase [Streptomyces finlayi]